MAMRFAMVIIAFLNRGVSRANITPAFRIRLYRAHQAASRRDAMPISAPDSLSSSIVSAAEAGQATLRAAATTK